MEALTTNKPHLTIHTTLEALKQGVFDITTGPDMPAIIDLQVFVEVEGRTAETRTKISREFLEEGPEAKSYIGRIVLQSIAQLPDHKSFDAQ